MKLINKLPEILDKKGITHFTGTNRNLRRVPLSADFLLRQGLRNSSNWNKATRGTLPKNLKAKEAAIITKIARDYFNDQTLQIFDVDETALTAVERNMVLPTIS